MQSLLDEVGLGHLIHIFQDQKVGDSYLGIYYRKALMKGVCNWADFMIC